MRIVVIVADGLQVAALGPYGNDWIATSNLNRLAAHAVVFDQHFAEALDGSAPRWEHNSVELHSFSLLPPWNPSVELLAEQFEDWEFEDEPEPWLDPQPGFLDAGNEAAFSQLQRTYSAVVREFDDQLGELLGDVPSDALLILTATRGQNLGEHGLIGDHRPWLHEELTHLPLVVRLSDGAEAGRRVGHLTRPADITATVHEALSRPHDGPGRSLVPLCRGGPAFRPYVATILHGEGSAEFALQSKREKVILPHGDPARRPMYFIKPDDRWEVNNLRQANLDRAEALEQTLLNYVESNRHAATLPDFPQTED
ncbi:MAG: hypothetical protein ACJ8F7_21330 [Gemmataceae bacterium]